MEHFISINYSGSVDEKYLAECLASSNQTLNEDALEFYTGKVGNIKTIRMPLPEAIENIEETAQELAMRLFEFGLKKFEIELTEATLRRGSRGPAVRKLQLDLGVQPADGVFGPATEAAVKDFQQRMMPGETADGIVGPKTNTAIQQSAAIDTGDNPEIEKSDPNSQFAALSGFATSRRGGIANNPSQVDAIKELQAELKRRGLLDGEVDGKYGPQTRAAVRAFQEQNDLYVDGDAGPRTIQKLMQRDDEITMTPLDDPQDGDPNNNNEPAADEPAAGENSRIKGPVPADVASQITQMNQDGDFAGIIALVDQYESLYTTFNNGVRDGSNPPETVYAYLQRMANQETTAEPEAEPSGVAVGDVATQEQSDTLKAIDPKNYPMPGEPLNQEDVDTLNDTDQLYTDTIAALDANPAPQGELGATDQAQTGTAANDQQPEITGSGRGDGAAEVAQRRADAEEPAEEFDATPIANNIQDAIKGLGTDEQAVYDAIQQVGSAENWAQVVEQYPMIYVDIYGDFGGQDLRKVKSELEKIGVDNMPASQSIAEYEARRAARLRRSESAGPRPKGAFMFRERNEWIAKYGTTHNIDGTRKRQNISEGLESLEETFNDDDEFFETYGIMWYNEDEVLDEAEYQGRKVKLGKPMAGDVKKFKVYVKNPKGNVVKVNFGQKGARIKKDNAARRRSFRARHNCSNPGPRHKARYWSCKKW